MANNSEKSSLESRQRQLADETETLADLTAELSEASRHYWTSQDGALSRARSANRKWSQKRREAKASEPVWKRETYSLPRAEAQAKAREFLNKYPKAAYWSEVESWRELPDDVIEFTMRRLPTAD